eukprot:483944-Prymnesium_polylepis.1
MCCGRRRRLAWRRAVWACQLSGVRWESLTTHARPPLTHRPPVRSAAGAAAAALERARHPALPRLVR